MMKFRNILKPGFFFCRMNVKVYRFAVHLYKKRSNWMRTIWEKSLTAVFNCLNQRIFCNSSAVNVNKNQFFVRTAHGRFSDYKSKRKIRTRTLYFIEKVFTFSDRICLCKSFCKSLPCLQVKPHFSVNIQAECSFRLWQSFFNESISAHQHFRSRTL